MTLSRLMFSSAALLASLLVFSLGITGHDEQQKKKNTWPCGDKTLNIGSLFGTNPYIIYVCEGDEVKWNKKAHTFKVKFDDDTCPFEDCTDISSGNPQLKSIVKHHDHFTLYHFTIKVDKGEPIDPVIVAGGGHGFGDEAAPRPK